MPNFRVWHLFCDEDMSHPLTMEVSISAPPRAVAFLANNTYTPANGHFR